MMLSELMKLLESGEYDRIVETLQSDAQTSEEYAILGIAYYNLGSKNKAISSFRKALRINPSYLDAHYNLAEIYFQIGKYQKAKEHALNFLRFSPNNWAIHDILSHIYEFEGFYDKAKEHIEKAILFAPDDVRALLKDKLEYLKNLHEDKKKSKKIAILCVKGLDNFIDDIIKGLQGNYWVQRWAVKTDKEIKAAIDWADIVWLEWANEVAIIGTNHSSSRTKPVVVRLHSYEVFTDMPLKINWSAVDTLIFVAPHIREILFERFPQLKPKIKRTEVVYNGIDLSKVPFKEREPGYETAWVGHINYKKAPELALQIIKKLVDIDPRYRLHFAGDFQDPRYEVYMKHMVKAMGIENNVIFHGWVDDMNEFWEDKNYFLHTSLHEGHPYAVMEAMARGIKPVIHWFRGAEKLYKREWLFKTVEEVVQHVINDAYDSESYRNFIKRYTLENQISKLETILRRLETLI